MRGRFTAKRILVCILAAVLCAAGMHSTAFAQFIKEKAATVQSIKVGEVTKTAKFALVFENTDDYLYRLGYSDSVRLGSLFEEIGDAEVDDASVSVTVTPHSTANGYDPCDADPSLSATVSLNTSAWEEGTITFTSYTGVVDITICDDTSEELTLSVEVIKGINYEDGDSLPTSAGNNLVLLADNAVSSTLSIGSAYTLYGNGFTLDVSEGTNTALGIVSLSGTIDNTQVVGAVYTSLGSTYGSAYNAASVIMYSGSLISNSYISGSRAAIRVANDATIEDTTVEGGYYSNIDIRDGDLVLEGDVVTINEPVTTGSSTVMGFGIVFNYENAEDATLTVNGTLTQYNWVCSSDKSYFYSDYQSYISTYIASGDYLHTYNGTTYANLAIISLDSDIGEEAVTGTSYEVFSKSSGNLWSNNSDYVMTADDLIYRSDCNDDYVSPADAWTADAEIPSLPSYSWSYPDTYVSSSDAIKLEFSSGNTETITGVSDYLTATKHGNTLEEEITVTSPDGVTAVSYDSSEDSITFSEGGTYTIYYTYTDPCIYNADADRTGDVVYHTQTLSVSVTVTTSVADPVFTFTDLDGNTYSGTVVYNENDGEYYVMPDVSETSDYVLSKTVNKITLYYVVTQAAAVKSGSNVVRYYPYFSGVSIRDYTDTEGNYTDIDASTFEVPDELETIQTTSDTSGWSGDTNVQSNGWDSDTSYTINSTSYYCMKTENMSASNWSDAVTVWMKFKYTAGNGITYTYYMGYDLPEASSSGGGGCFPAGTLITLADGTQVPAEELSVDEQLLTFDHETGSFSSSSIIFYEEQEYDTYEVLYLEFSNGDETGIIWEHGFFDVTLNKYVYLTPDDYEAYIGHVFVAGDGENIEYVTLDGAYVEEVETVCYGIETAGDLNLFTNGILSVEALTEGFMNIFEYGDDLAYDAEKKAADIETYGLSTYDEWSDYASEELFYAYKGPYLKVAMGKGTLTYEGILSLIDRFGAYFLD